MSEYIKARIIFVMVDYQILGQSNYAIAILLDTLRQCHKGRITVEIVSNIAVGENQSLAYSYDTDGIETTEVDHTTWQRNPNAKLLIGSIGRGREQIFDFFSKQFGIDAQCYYNTLDQRANLPHALTLGRGIHVSPGATIAPHAVLNDFVVVNRNASIGHHTVLEPFVTVNPGVHVAGICNIARGVTIGVGASVVDGVTIGKHSVIGAGSVVTRDIPGDVIAYGSPARVIRQR